MTIQQVLLMSTWTPVYAKWNSAYKSSDITLSNADLTATFGSAAAGKHSTRGTIAKSNGAWYWEVTVDSLTDVNAPPQIGIATSAMLTSEWIGDRATGWGWDGANKYTNGGGSAYGSTLFQAGDVVGVALNLDAGTLVFYKNNSSAGTAASGLSGTFYPALSDNTTASDASTAVTANFGPTFTYTPPVGFSPLFS